MCSSDLGIIYTGPNDSPELLAKDITVAGAEYNYTEAVRYLCEDGPKAVERILFERVGVPFERTANGECFLTREGGHSVHRILACADYTGRAIQDSLSRAVQEHDNIRILYNRTAIDLLATRHQSTRLEFRYQLSNQCVGAYVFNEIGRAHV